MSQTVHEAVRNTSASIYKELLSMREKIADETNPLVGHSFPLNVSCQLMAISIAFMLEERQGSETPNEEFVDKVFRIRRKLNKGVDEVMAEFAGPGWASVRMVVEEPDEEKGGGEGAGSDERVGGEPS